MTAPAAAAEEQDRCFLDPHPMPLLSMGRSVRVLINTYVHTRAGEPRIYNIQISVQATRKTGSALVESHVAAEKPVASVEIYLISAGGKVLRAHSHRLTDLSVWEEP